MDLKKRRENAHKTSIHANKGFCLLKKSSFWSCVDYVSELLNTSKAAGAKRTQLGSITLSDGHSGVKGWSGLKGMRQEESYSQLFSAHTRSSVMRLQTAT